MHDPSRCWICGDSKTVSWKDRSLPRLLTPDDLRITDSRYGLTLALRRCLTCGFLFAEGEDLQNLTGLYEALEDPGYEESQDSRALQMRWLLDRLRALRPAAHTLLDIGAGAGLLVAEARRQGLEAEGVEPSRRLVDAARHPHGVDLMQGTFPHPALAERRFDVVLLVDVIEHVADPVGLLRACAGALTCGGVLAVVTPDAGSLAARAFGRRWWHYRLAHVGYFQARSAKRAFQEAGLTVLARFRARWFFRIHYVAERLARYLPLGRLNAAVLRTRAGQKLYARVVPLNPCDSFVFVLGPGERAAR